jgi:hypothetical protein
MFFSARSNNGAGDVHQQRPCAASANVDAEEVDVGSVRRNGIKISEAGSDEGL